MYFLYKNKALRNCGCAIKREVAAWKTCLCFPVTRYVHQRLHSPQTPFFFQFDREQRRARNASDPLVAKRKGPREAKRRGETSRSCSPSRLPLRGNLHQEGELWEGGRWWSGWCTDIINTYHFLLVIKTNSNVAVRAAHLKCDVVTLRLESYKECTIGAVCAVFWLGITTLFTSTALLSYLKTSIIIIIITSLLRILNYFQSKQPFRLGQLYHAKVQRLEPKYLPQVSLGSLQRTHRSAIGQFFPLSLLTDPEVFENINSAQFPSGVN